MSAVEPSAKQLVHDLLVGMVAADASDLHVVPGYRPTYRVRGRLAPTGTGALEPALAAEMISAVIPAELVDRFRACVDLDFSVALPGPDGELRFRGNVFRSRGHICGCFRHIPEHVPSFDWMGFPAATAEEIVNLHNGLVIVTGITGSGKSTTLAGIIDLMNQRGGYRIITVEEPVEYIYERTEGTVITQREVGIDCPSFYEGLKYGLRQDPNVILIGEIRDQDTAQMALSASETGHLILTTMHSKDAKGAVTRFVDLFPNRDQDDIRAQLALSLRYVITQHLLPGPNPGDRRALAVEKMVVNLPVRAAIKTGKIDSIESAIQTGKADGMIRLDDSLQALVDAGRINYETARRFAKRPEAISARPFAGR